MKNGDCYTLVGIVSTGNWGWLHSKFSDVKYFMDNWDEMEKVKDAVDACKKEEE